MKTNALAPRAPRDLLDRILDTPDLANVVKSLEPKLLHQLLRHCGLEDCGEILALATTDQLTRIFDDDLWTSERPGAHDRFDAERFGVWLEVLAEMGGAAAAQRLSELDFDLVTAAISRHVLVVDMEALLVSALVVDPETADDYVGHDFDVEAHTRAVLGEALDDALGIDLAGYRLIARPGGSWDALLGVLVELEHSHGDFLGRLLKRCCDLATEWIIDNGGLYEVLSSEAQVDDDAAGARERRREREGYVAPSQAAAFLELSRQRRAQDHVSPSYFRELERRVERPATAPAFEPKLVAFLESLREGGALPAPRRDLLPAAPADAGRDRFARIRAHLLFVREHDEREYARRTEELAYLANVLISGCSLGSRRFRSVEAADAVLATCNLGLENRDDEAKLPASLGLLGVFQRGWSVLHTEVSLYVARRLVEELAALRCPDRWIKAQLQDAGRRLRAELERGAPWRAVASLDVIAMLDPEACATLTGLLGECPVLPKGEFFSENQEIESVHEFARSLPRRLRAR